MGSSCPEPLRKGLCRELWIEVYGFANQGFGLGVKGSKFSRFRSLDIPGPKTIPTYTYPNWFMGACFGLRGKERRDSDVQELSFRDFSAP